MPLPIGSSLKLSRRAALGGLLASLSPLALGGCMTGPVRDPDIWARATIASLPHGAFFDAHQMSLLTDVTAFILPVPPAAESADAGTIAFLDTLMTGWAVASSRRNMLSVVDQIELAAVAMHGAPYVTLKTDKRRAVVKLVDAAAFGEGVLADQEPGKSRAWRYYKELAFVLFDRSQAGDPTYVRVPGFYSGDMSREDYLQALRDNAENFTRFEA